VANVTVSARHPSRIVLDFGDDTEVLTNACVLLCGHVGALALLELGYTGPLVTRPPVAARAPARPRDGADAAGGRASTPGTKRS